MSNPPFRSPLFSEDDDFFYFPIEAPNDPNNNPPPVDEINPVCLPSSSQPISEYQDLSMFLDDHEEDYALIGQYASNIHETNIDYVEQTKQLGLDQVVDEATWGSIIAHHEMQYGPMMMGKTMIDAQTAGAAGEVGEGSSSKKLDHNAKERVRRLKLNATYTAFRSLLPDTRRAKKRWSAPYIIDRALDYIPHLQSEIEKLTLQRNNMVSVIGKKQVFRSKSSDDQLANDEDKKTLTVSINEVNSGEVIIQICEQRDKVDILSTLIEKLEGDGMQVVGASSLHACKERSCFHLNVQMGENSRESGYVAVLHKKIISWLS